MVAFQLASSAISQLSIAQRPVYILKTVAVARAAYSHFGTTHLKREREQLFH